MMSSWVPKPLSSLTVLAGILPGIRYMGYGYMGDGVWSLWLTNRLCAVIFPSFNKWLERTSSLGKCKTKRERNEAVTQRCNRILDEHRLHWKIAIYSNLKENQRIKMNE